MINKNDILKALRDGVSVDDIFKEVAAALNDAIAEYDRETEEKEFENEKEEKADNLVYLIHDFMIDYYGSTTENINLIEEVFKGVNGKVFCTTLETALKAVKSVSLIKEKNLTWNLDNKGISLFAALDQLREEEKHNCKKSISDISVEEADKIIKSFLELL